jgi:hypothetical protein
VWIYGDPSTFDQVADCGLPPVVARRVTYTGYLGHRRPATLSAPIGSVPSNPFALCLVGDGQDGLDLARAFVQARLPEASALERLLADSDLRRRLAGTARYLVEQEFDVHRQAGELRRHFVALSADMALKHV